MGTAGGYLRAGESIVSIQGEFVLCCSHSLCSPGHWPLTYFRSQTFIVGEFSILGPCLLNLRCSDDIAVRCVLFFGFGHLDAPSALLLRP